MTHKRPFRRLNPEKQWEFGSRGNIGAKIVANISIINSVNVITTTIIITTITNIIYCYSDSYYGGVLLIVIVEYAPKALF